jgi:hypothetical protein
MTKPPHLIYSRVKSAIPYSRIGSVIPRSQRRGIREGEQVGHALATHYVLRHILPALSVAALILTLAACAAPTPTPTPTPTPDPIVPAFQSITDVGDGALLTGTLTLDGRCLYVVDEFGQRWLPYLRAEYLAWEGGIYVGWKDGALVYGPERYQPGDNIVLGGGEAYGAAKENVPLIQLPDPSCDTSNVWISSRPLAARGRVL